MWLGRVFQSSVVPWMLIPVPAVPVEILRSAFWMPIPVPEFPAVPSGAASASLIPVLAVPVLTSGVADAAPPFEPCG